MMLTNPRDAFKGVKVIKHMWYHSIY